MECNPDAVDPGPAGRLPGARGEPAVLRRPVAACPMSSRASGAPMTRPPWPAPSTGPGPPGSTTATSTSSTAARGVARRLAPDPGGRPRTRPAARQRLRPDGGGGHAARPEHRRGGPERARRRRPGRQVRAGRRDRSARPGWPGTRSRTGPGPGTSAATTASTGRRASTSGSAAPPTATPAGRRWWNVRTPDRYIAADRPGGSPEAGGEELDAGPGRRSGSPWPCGRAPGWRWTTTPALVADGLAAWDSGRLVLTRTGRLLANAATIRLHLQAEDASPPSVDLSRWKTATPSTTARPPSCAPSSRRTSRRASRSVPGRWPPAAS